MGKRNEEIINKNLHKTEFVITDQRDGQTYNCVDIYGHVWMAENLAYLPQITSSMMISNAEPCFYVYNYSSEEINNVKICDTFKKFGVLYNWEAAKEACPNGWHLPSSDEWKTLKYIIDASKYIDQGMKRRCLWSYERMKIVFGGNLYSSGRFSRISDSGYWWSNFSEDDMHAFAMKINKLKLFEYEKYDKSRGFSIRCIRD